MCNEIAANIPLLINLLEQKLSPDEICSLLKFCDSSKRVPVVSVEAQSVVSCLVCKEIVTLVENKLASNATETEIEDGLQKLCQSKCKH